MCLLLTIMAENLPNLLRSQSSLLCKMLSTYGTSHHHITFTSLFPFLSIAAF
jgi:hypothetical protein